MNLIDPSNSLLGACGGDTVKLFHVSAQSRDPCILSYTPSPAYQVNSVKWNHTNLVVASAGDDKKISLWLKNGQSMGTIPVAGSDAGDNIEESICTINFSNKGSRYICSGGSGQVVRIWDLQRKRCIKWLRGHTDTIIGAMYNCKDEHLASISLTGDLILHNLASGARAAELKDPNGQVLRVLDYSRISRHLLVTAGDDGSVHLWDTTNRSPKVSWLKQHSAPTAGVNFSPSNDKIIVSVGLDKKLYTLDSGTRRPAFCIPYEAPFSSVAYRDDGLILAAGTSNGHVVFYDVRGKPEPLTVLRAYGNSEAVTNLCWQRSKPVVVNENTCTAEAALLGGAVEDSILMPDPLPSVVSSSLAISTTVMGSRNPGHPASTVESSALSVARGVSTSSTLSLSTTEETPVRSSLWGGGALSRLHAPRVYNFKDDMEVFSPLVEVLPITVLRDRLWDDHEGVKKNYDKKPLLFPSSRRFSFADEVSNEHHPIFDRISSSSSKQDDASTSFPQLVSTPNASSKSIDSSSITPPEAWGGERLSERLIHHRQSVTMPSRFALAGSLVSGSMFPGFQDLTSSTGQMNTASLTSSNLSMANLSVGVASSNQETSSGFSEDVPSSPTLSIGAKGITGQANFESLGAALNLSRRFSSYAERISTTPSFGDATLSVGSPKNKKTGAETREELLTSLRSRSDAPSATEPGILPSTNGGIAHPKKNPLLSDSPQGTSFPLQLFQRTLEETLGSFQKSIHEEMRNLHIEILRQFHMQEMEMSSMMSSILENQTVIMKEIQFLREENQQLRQSL